MAPMATPMMTPMTKGGSVNVTPMMTPTAHKGGAVNASTYAEAVYGSAANQHANLAQGNVIAMNKVMGGKSRKNRRNKRGGSMFVDLAVPATLFFAQQNSRKPGMGMRKSRSSRRSSRRSRQTRRK